MMHARSAVNRTLVAVAVAGLMLTPTPSAANDRPAVSESANAQSGEWISGVEDGLRHSEYHFRFAPASYRSEPGEVFQAPNRAHGLRLYLDEHGLEVLDRTAEGVPTLLRLRLLAVGRDDQLIDAGHGQGFTDKNTLGWTRDGLVETTLNTEHGVQLAWEILDPPEGDGGLTIELGLSAAGVTVNRDRVAIRSTDADRRLHLGRLEAVDATGAPLPARFESSSGALHVVIDDASAVYPVTVKTLLDGLADSTIELDQANAALGVAVAGAGDVNGDGFSDVIVGASAYDSGETDEGAAFVFLGDVAGIDTSYDVRLESDQAEADFGCSVAGAGDVNGDGYSDVIVGAKYYNSGQDREGAAFVFLGSASGVSGTDPGTAHAQIESNQASGFLGQSVAGAGDVNGDGYADVVVGTASLGTGGTAFVFHGGSSGITGTSPGDADTRIDGDQPGGAVGQTVAGAGDVNRDGYADVIVGAPEYDAGANDDGAAFVHLGSPSGISSTFQVRLQVDQDDAFFGWSVAGAGDVNGDGYADVIVGAKDYEDSDSEEGGAFVFHGGPRGLIAAFATKITADQVNASLGQSVAGLGDVNGDGYADVAAAAPGFDDGETDEGAAFVFLGSATGVQADSPGDALAQLETNQSGAGGNLNAAGAGDVNGDGYADVIVGAPAFDNGQTNEGVAFVYHGGGLGIMGSDAATADAAIESDQMGTKLGYSVSGAGDVNGDGYADLIVGSPYYDLGEMNEGAAFVFLGGEDGVIGTDPGTAHATIESNQDGAGLGTSVNPAGDVNGDGFADIIIGTPSFDNGESDEGAAFVFHGSAMGITGSDPSNSDALIESDQVNSQLGFSASGAGDVNGDGFSDVVVGAPTFESGETGEGAAFVFLGSENGIVGTSPGTAHAQIESNQAVAQFGCSVSGAGDVNGDGYADVIFGSSRYETTVFEGGCAFVYHGSPTGISGSGPIDADAQLCGSIFFGWSGYSVSSAGDVNADGYSDVIIGSPGMPNGPFPSGKFTVHRGSATGVVSGPTIANVMCDASCDGLGYSVASLGDVNGDGFGDVVVGAHYPMNSSANTTLVFHGGPSGILGSGPTSAERRIDGLSMGFSVSGAGDVDGDGFADLIVGDPDHGGGAAGGAFVFLGGGDQGRHVLTRQLRGSSQNDPVQPWGTSTAEDEFQVRMTATHPAGRGHLRLEVEACPPALAFGDPGCVTQISTGWVDAPTGAVELTETVSGLTFGTLYRWRARVLYGGLADAPGVTPPPHPPHGPWRRLDGQADEADIRVYDTNADLSLSVDDDPDPVTGLEPLTYALDVTNSGPDEASGVSVVDTLPTGTTYSNATGTGWSCDHTAGVVTCSRSSLPVGAAPPITIEVIAPPLAGMITNAAVVSATELDRVPADNEDIETTDVTSAPQADLSISKSGSGVVAVRGTSYSYTITASSPVTAVGSSVSDVFPADLENVTWSCVGTNAICAASGSGNITDTVDFLAGGVVTYTATGTVSATALSMLENTATVAPPTGVWDPNSVDNTATAETTVADPGEVIFLDGFESGNTTAWSSAVGGT